MKKILFITTANLATNPRLLKEVNTAQSKGYFATIILFRLGNWSDAKTDQIISEIEKFNKVTFIHIHAIKQPIFPWLFWGVMEKFASLIYPYLKSNLVINALASSRRSFQIYQKCKSGFQKTDLICAHNLGSLFPAWHLGRKWDIPFIFDVEDYHPGEFIRKDAKNERQRREFLMKRMMPDAVSITSASPLIGKYAMNLIGGHKSHHTVMNSFPLKEFIEPKEVAYSAPLQLVWFSQKISIGRGLEELFEALRLMKDNAGPLINMELTLIGDMDEDFSKAWISPIKKIIPQFRIHIIHPMKQGQLHRELANYDVGLALEFSKTDLNRQLCLTNKIFAYAQAGLFILATDTPAQQDLVQTNPWLGKLCGQSVDLLSRGLIYLSTIRSEIKSKKKERFQLGKSLAWEKESMRLMELLNARL